MQPRPGAKRKIPEENCFGNGTFREIINSFERFVNYRSGFRGFRIRR